MDNQNQTPDEDIVAVDPAAAQAEHDAAGVGEAPAEGSGQDFDLAGAMQEAQEAQRQANADAEAARANTDPSATYVRGVEGANVNRAVPAGVDVITDYEQALEAGYIGAAAGQHNTEMYSVQAVTQRDRELGLPGTKGLTDSVVNGAGGDESSDEDGVTRLNTARTSTRRRSQRA